VSLKLRTVAVIGGGAWGTALAALAACGGRRVIMWMRDQATTDSVNRLHANPRHLPDILLPEAIEAVTDGGRLAAVDAVIAAVPAQSMREVLTALAPHIPRQAPVVIAAKGYEQRTMAPMSGIVLDTLKTMPYILSGPTFAADIARGLPAAAVLAGWRRGDTAQLGNALATPNFRIYFSDDIAGVQFGGAVKNVLAIACGMAAGMKLGDSARAALITRAAAELTRLGRANRIRHETLSGLSCLGDLILTAMSPQSRNFSLGFALGEGRSLADALASSRGVCEGVWTAPVVEKLAHELATEAPICAAVAAILDGRSTPAEQMAELLGRPLKPE
jgi:glycerol-3-phosphate dehydrogenase (NAD(P)+)